LHCLCGSQIGLGLRLSQQISQGKTGLESDQIFLCELRQTCQWRLHVLRPVALDDLGVGQDSTYWPCRDTEKRAFNARR